MYYCFTPDNLVTKYGLVPQDLYPDSWNAMSSGTLNYIVVSKLREYALKLRKLASATATTSATLSATKQRMMREIHLILTLTLGPPPSSTQKFGALWIFLPHPPFLPFGPKYRPTAALILHSIRSMA